MLEVFQWLGYILLYLFNPDEIASAVIGSYQASWWLHELLLFAHHALLFAGEVLIVVLVRRYPRPFMPVWWALRWLWFRIRQFVRWLGRHWHFHIRTGSLANRPARPKNGKRLKRSDIFLTGATPYVAKLAAPAVVLQWPEFGWSGFLAAWLGGCLRIAVYPFIGDWVFAFILAYAVIRWRRYIWWFFLWVKSCFGRIVL